MDAGLEHPCPMSMHSQSSDVIEHRGSVYTLRQHNMTPLLQNWMPSEPRN